MSKIANDVYTVTEKEYLSAVNKCKKLIQMVKEMKYEVAKISYLVCYSKPGGKLPKGHYSVMKFAEDIGIGYKALQRWRREYSLVISKLDIKKPKKKNNRKVNHQKVRQNPDKGVAPDTALLFGKHKGTPINRKALEATLKEVSKDTPKKKVNEIYNSYLKKGNNADDAYILDIIKRIRTIDFAINHRFILKKMDQKDLKLIHDYAKSICEGLDDHFSGKKSKSRKNAATAKSKALAKISKLKENL